MSTVLDPRAAPRLMQLGPRFASATASVAPTAQRWKAFVVSVLTMLGRNRNRTVLLLASAARNRRQRVFFEERDGLG